MAEEETEIKEEEMGGKGKGKLAQPNQEHGWHMNRELMNPGKELNIHGLRLAFRRKFPLVVRLAWLLLFLASFVVLICMIVNQVVQYLSIPTRIGRAFLGSGLAAQRGQAQEQAKPTSEPVRGERAIEILEQPEMSIPFKEVDATELLPELTPWFIRRNQKDKILNPLKHDGDKKGAATLLLDTIIEQLEKGDNKHKISLQDLIAAEAHKTLP